MKQKELNFRFTATGFRKYCCTRLKMGMDWPSHQHLACLLLRQWAHFQWKGTNWWSGLSLVAKPLLAKCANCPYTYTYVSIHIPIYRSLISFFQMHKGQICTLITFLCFQGAKCSGPSVSRQSLFFLWSFMPYKCLHMHVYGFVLMGRHWHLLDVMILYSMDWPISTAQEAI